MRIFNPTEDEIADAPKIECHDEATWQSWKEKNQSDQGKAIIAYAERWAILMQAEIDKGKKLEDIAESTSDEANVDYISIFMHRAAIYTLATCWKYGTQLLEWHEKQ